MKGYYAEKEKLDERIASAEERLRQFAQAYGFALPLKEEVLDRISDDVNTHASQQKRYEEAQAKRTKFQTEHPEFKNGLSEEQKKQEKLPAVDALIEAEKWKRKNWRSWRRIFRQHGENGQNSCRSSSRFLKWKIKSAA